MSLNNQPFWHPAIFGKRRENLEKRAQIFSALRKYFESQGFLEVQTPALQVSPGLEPHLQAFQTELIDPVGGVREKRYLHTSPEFSMKKLLAAGLPKIYQISLVYRNRERSHTHHPEFSMLEWYRAGADYTVLMDDCEKILKACAERVCANKPFTRNNVESNPLLPFERLSVQEAFERYAETDILGAIDNPHAPSAAGLLPACVRLGIPTAKDDSWEDLFFRIFLERIEPKLGVGRPTILYDYPISMAALSRPKKGDPKLAERFELYVCGLELANAFGELTDPVVQRRRFEADMEKKQRLYGEKYPLDEDFLAAMSQMPESAGIALGVDRLIMLATGATDIEDVIWVPVQRSDSVGAD